jgi:hypothetical protein
MARPNAKARTLTLAALVLFVVLVSIFLGTLLVITPVIRDFDAATYIRVQQAMTRHVTPIVTGVIGLAAAVTVAVAWEARSRRASWRWPLVALACLAGIALSSVVINVPINANLQSWSPTRPPTNWGTLRDRWDAFHVLRTGLSVGGLACVLFVLAQREDA